ncbi:MAG: zinc ribbon domain-containing protein [Candidatus Faecivicinus sp.]|nr:zinc ribbon domain-containing protein [Candidatus Faecivicinus sp.]
MDFLNDLGKRFTRVARSVQERTREGWESTRLSADLYSLRGDLERQYTALGEAYFKAVSAGEEVPQELVSRVKATVDRIDELTALRENRVRCPACGSFQAPEARFCSKCGRRMPEDAPEPVEEPVEEDESEYCPECGAMRHEDSNFCAVCGHAFAANAAKEEPEAPAKPEPAAPSEPPAEEPDHEPDEEE